MRQVRDCFTDMPGSDHHQRRFGLYRFHKNLHLTAAHAGIAAAGVGHVVFQQARLAILDRLAGFGDHTVFHLAAADGAEQAAIGVDQHLAAGLARRRALLRTTVHSAASSFSCSTSASAW